MSSLLPFFPTDINISSLVGSSLTRSSTESISQSLINGFETTFPSESLPSNTFIKFCLLASTGIVSSANCLAAFSNSGFGAGSVLPLVALQALTFSSVTPNNSQLLSSAFATGASSITSSGIEEYCLRCIAITSSVFFPIISSIGSS